MATYKFDRNPDVNILFHFLTYKGVKDETGEIAKWYTDKYFTYAIESGTMGNWTAMIPGKINHN